MKYNIQCNDERLKSHKQKSTYSSLVRGFCLVYVSRFIQDLIIYPCALEYYYKQVIMNIQHNQWNPPLVSKLMLLQKENIISFPWWNATMLFPILTCQICYPLVMLNFGRCKFGPSTMWKDENTHICIYHRQLVYPPCCTFECLMHILYCVATLWLVDQREGVVVKLQWSLNIIPKWSTSVFMSVFTLQSKTVRYKVKQWSLWHLSEAWEGKFKPSAAAVCVPTVVSCVHNVIWSIWAAV